VTLQDRYSPSRGENVPSIAVAVSDDLAGFTIAGRSVRDHWRALFAAAGLPYSEEPADIVVDGRRLAMEPEELRSLAFGAELGDGIHVVDQVTRAIAEQLVVRRFVNRLLSEGVIIHDPGSVWVEGTVQVAAGATLWKGCVLRGTTRVGAGAVVHPGVILDDTEVGEGAQVLAHSVCSGARIGPDCSVGPMAHLRPGTVLEREVKVGNFVEVKKTHLHEGAKASHLTYLGDATVGAHANVGAGTITCNYDGYGKHPTTIGAGAFIGSNTALVAPIRVGEGAIVGAGSTLTRDVPDHALVLERAEERVYPGKAKALAERNRRRAEAQKTGKSSG
jgi:bifunctional UDP-N-acetylglucosamine pyrophosphorylase/glucosamine-1-phosphate N-acetyltransferase